jgi:hypothetical protein
MKLAVWNRRWLEWVAVAALFVVIVGALASRRPKLPRSIGIVASEVRVGMSRDEVVTLLLESSRKAGCTDRFYLKGETIDGWEIRGFGCTPHVNLPPGDRIAWAELDIDDDDCRDLYITFGLGGVVTGVRLRSSSVWEELRYAVARD